MIGDDIELTIVDIRGDKVRVGIKAPPSVPVHRKEVYDAIRKENEGASSFKRTDLNEIPPPVQICIFPRTWHRWICDDKICL